MKKMNQAECGLSFNTSCQETLTLSFLCCETRLWPVWRTIRGRWQTGQTVSQILTRWRATAKSYRRYNLCVNCGWNKSVFFCWNLKGNLQIKVYTGCSCVITALHQVTNSFDAFCCFTSFLCSITFNLTKWIELKIVAAAESSGQ